MGIPSGARVGRRSVFLIALAAFAFLAAPVGRAAPVNAYVVTPLVSNVPGMAPTVDSNLVNAWGLVAGPTSPWWVADNGMDVSTLYNAAGTKIPLTVTVDSAPTGIVFNGDSTNFLVAGPGTAARFIFSTEAGAILGWSPATGPAAIVKADSSDEGNVYKGLAYAITPTGPRLYATDFFNARVEMYSGVWADVDIPGSFHDPSIPAGYAPFGIQAIGSRIFVTYAKQSPECCDELHGQGLGFVDAYDLDGTLLVGVAHRGQLNAPWGLAMAPAGFGRFSGDLLVGNFADGHVNAYEEMANGHFVFRGFLLNPDGTPLAIDGLWALEFGNGAPNNGPVNTLFFTAGPNDESDGLFGTIMAA